MNVKNAAGALITVDWGTTNFRALLLDGHGAVLDRIDEARGVLHVARGDFVATFRSLLAPWLEQLPAAPVVMAGMVGSVDGLVEVPYLPCPVSLDDIAGGMVRIPGLDDERTVLIVPGLRATSLAGNHDVMRGEEAQIIGALGDGSAQETQVFCLPGTHSKWVTVEGRRVIGFSTNLTGDAYTALREQTILGRLMETDAHDVTAFERGLDQAARPGGLLHHLFSVRTEALLGDLPSTSAGSYLSGVLIGHEVGAMLAAEGHGGDITVIGGNVLTDLYGRAVRYFGRDVHCIDGGEAAHRGLRHLVAVAGLHGGES